MGKPNPPLLPWQHLPGRSVSISTPRHLFVFLFSTRRWVRVSRCDRAWTDKQTPAQVCRQLPVPEGARSTCDDCGRPLAGEPRERETEDAGPRLACDTPWRHADPGVMGWDRNDAPWAKARKAGAR